MRNRYIWIVRHAKSAEGEPGMRDHDRPLNPRGESNGSTMQAWFSNRANKPAWIWTSTAVRAQATAAFIAAGTDAVTVESADLYLAGPEAALACLDWVSLDLTRWRAVASVCFAAASTSIEESLIVVTSSRRASIA